MLAAAWVDVIFRDDGFSDRSDRDRLLHQRPDSSADLLEAVVDTISEIQENEFVVELAGEHVVRCDDGSGV